MSKLRNIGGNTSFVSIRYASSSKVLPNANEHEKSQTPVIDIEALRNISRIVRCIQARIDAAERTSPGCNPQKCGAGDPSSSEDPSANRCQNNDRESAENR